MVINSQIKQTVRGGPVLLHGKITTYRAGRPRNIKMWTEGWENLRKKGDENSELFSNTEIQSGDEVFHYLAEAQRDRRKVAK
jgi:hypothetical protein